MFNQFRRTGAMILLFALSTGVVFSFQNCAKEMVNQYDNQQEDETYGAVEEEGFDQTVVDEAVKVETEGVSVVMMDRNLLRSVFIDVFGPTLATHALLQQIESDQSTFGSPCSFADNYLGAVSGNNRVAFCNNTQATDTMGANVLPSVNVLRAARVNELCYVATMTLDNNDGVTGPTNYVINRLKATPTGPLPESSDENILKMFYLFYRGKPAPQPELIESLRAIIGTPVTKAGWKNAIYTTCVSGHWQVL